MRVFPIVPQVSITELAILLVEPSLTQRRIITRQLSEAGNRNVESVSSPDEAWDIMARACPDLVLSAMYFDTSTGRELVERMRADETLETVPFVLISSENRWESLEPIKQAGVMAILPKPFAIDDLVMALEAAAEFVDADEDSAEFLALDGVRVLVVDDSLTSRKHIIAMLEKMGLENIASACDGAEAVTMLDASLFDLVLTDYNMPEMDGERLVNYIRKESSQSSIPIIMITSENNEARLDAVIKSGVSAICDKPFDLSTVRALVHKMVS